MVIWVAITEPNHRDKNSKATQLAVIEQETSTNYNTQTLTANVRYMDILSKDIVGPNAVYTVCKFKFVFLIAVKVSTGEIYSMQQATNPDSGQPVLCSEVKLEAQL